VGRQRGI
jgi:hypothetical protein